MNFEKVNNILRMSELAGRTIKVSDVDNISEEAIELTEQELDSVPYHLKKVIEGKVHVLGFDNKLVLKPVDVKSVEDKTLPSLNKVKDYEKDGGDPSKLNDKMIDNELEEGVGPVTSHQVKQAEEVLDKKKSRLRNVDVKKDYTKKDKEDAEYEALMNKKREQETAEKLAAKARKLRMANEQAEDATVYTGTNFSKEDEEEYLGLPEVRDIEIKLPPEVRKDANKRIKEIEASIKDYDDKGYNDGAGANSNKNKAIDAIEQLLDNLSSNDYEGFKKAQLFYLTLMSPITDLLPASLVNFLANGATGREGNDELLSKVEPHETDLKENDLKIRSLLDIISESKRKRRKKKMDGEDPCWDDHEMIGHKKDEKGNKVPNCVPKD